VKNLILAIVAVASVAGVSAAANSDDDQVIKECLSHWPGHPFSNKATYRTISPQVKVMGIGKDILDDVKTDKPELVLIKPNVAVMSKTAYNLLNPNGWYCMKGRVAVLGKTQIRIGCKTKLATPSEAVSVMGGSDDGAGGVAVLGSVRIERNCH
jgi:hypothetical protein